MVRAFLGLTEDNLTLYRADKLMQDPETLNLVEPDDLDQYIEQVEVFMRGLADVDGLSYDARSDFGSTETFKKDSKSDFSSKYLDQSRESVETVKKALSKIVRFLKL